MAQTCIRVGIIGAGFIAETRARAYAAVMGHDVRLVAVASRTRHGAEEYARRHHIEAAHDDYRRVLERTDVDLVDLCVLNHLHRPITEEAAAAGKHIICAKPLTAFHGAGLPPDTVPSGVTRSEMLRTTLESADAMVTAAARAGVQLMYAENWVYAPPIAKAERLAAASGGTILEMRGGECHSGSHSPYSKEWRTAGGGALLRLGVHPIGAMLHLKRKRASAAPGVRSGRAPLWRRSATSRGFPGSKRSAGTGS